MDNQYKNKSIVWHRRTKEPRAVSFGLIKSTYAHKETRTGFVYRVDLAWEIKKTHRGWALSFPRATAPRGITEGTVQAFAQKDPASVVQELTGVPLAEFLNKPGYPLGGHAWEKAGRSPLADSPPSIDRPLKQQWDALQGSTKKRLITLAKAKGIAPDVLAYDLIAQGVTVPDRLIEMLLEGDYLENKIK